MSLFFLPIMFHSFYSIAAIMGPSFTASLLLLFLASPLIVLAQGGHNHGGGFSRPGAPQPPVTPTTAPTTADTATPTNPTESTTQATNSVTVPTGTTTPTSAGTATSTSTTPSSTGGGSCSGSGMEIEWTGDKVSFSWSGGSGTTTGCTSLGSNFEGQVAVGGSGGTIFEGNPSGYFDVSYILGYSVPMVCSANGAKTGCSKDLLGNGGKAGTVHKNPTGPGGAHDPGSYNGCATCKPWCYACAAADPFFAPCSGSAYTYPYDDGATVGPASGPITCCIGTSCGTTGREGSTASGHPELTRNPQCGLCAGGSKRSVDELENIFRRYEEEAPALSASLLPRRKKAHKRHAAAHDAAKVMS